jgi:hypothetical protein
MDTCIITRVHLDACMNTRVQLDACIFSRIQLDVCINTRVYIHTCKNTHVHIDTCNNTRIKMDTCIKYTRPIGQCILLVTCHNYTWLVGRVSTVTCTVDMRLIACFLSSDGVLHCQGWARHTFVVRTWLLCDQYYCQYICMQHIYITILKQEFMLYIHLLSTPCMLSLIYDHQGQLEGWL